MARRKASALAWTRNFGERATKKRKVSDDTEIIQDHIEMHDELPEILNIEDEPNNVPDMLFSFMDGPTDIETDSWSEMSSCCGGESDFAENELQNESDLTDITTKLMAGMQIFLGTEKTRKRPRHYKLTVRPAASTLRRHRSNTGKATKSLRATGYGDIRDFWKQKPKSSQSADIVLEQPILNPLRREEEEETDDEIELLSSLSTRPGERTEEEEEEEMEEIHGSGSKTSRDMNARIFPSKQHATIDGFYLDNPGELLTIVWKWFAHFIHIQKCPVLLLHNLQS
ncbi:hypothetical protein M422DRAFT_276646 [Sphaerobolus stellatus SS14]|uniref:Unplaced genomic scaffold SPHSTscaffold_825, whole genome shotgun sequence n=1 Tax=Sphaerobolus stellatus (strain SS14) TaxID=990650 RepID=A0A0C9TM15_SPHS4|nr:hypothetical protein M422DRAFT_276646 [Sphaerobolus stellatus SS14]